MDTGEKRLKPKDAGKGEELPEQEDVEDGRREPVPVRREPEQAERQGHREQQEGDELSEARRAGGAQPVGEPPRESGQDEKGDDP